MYTPRHSRSTPDHRWWRRSLGALATTAVGLAVLVATVVLVVTGGGRSAMDLPVAAAPGDVTAPSPPSVLPVKALRKGLLHVPPVEVVIPSLGVRSRLVDLRLERDGALQVPVDYARAGWYRDGPYPGDAGGPPALVVGHVDSDRGPAVFYRLHQLRSGDRVSVRRKDGSTAVFLVYGAKQYSKDSFPGRVVYAPSVRAELRLITCSGEYDRARRSYSDNYVVFAALDAAASGVRR